MRIVLFGFIAVMLVQCSLTQKAADGTSSFDRKQYAVAIDYLLEEYESSRKKEEKAQKAFYLGESYRHQNLTVEAADWYRKAVRHDYGLAAVRELAFAYKRLENYDGAISMFEKLKDYNTNTSEIRKEIAKCKTAKQWKSVENNPTFDVSKSKIFTDGSNYAPQYYGESQLIFTSDRTASSGDASYQWTGRDFSDIYISNLDGTIVRAFDEAINTESNEGVPCFTKAGDEMFFTRCYDLDEDADQYCKILYSKKYEGQWEEPKPVFSMKDGINYGQTTLVENDSVLIMSCDDPSGYGGFDLFYSVLDEEGWSIPEPMPSNINTVGNEKFPTSDGDTLYFSSDYHTGMGGLDIFKTYLDKNDLKWADPVNLKPPFNSGADDFSYSINTQKRNRTGKIEGVFSTSRSATGLDEIYNFYSSEFALPSEEVVEVEKNLEPKTTFEPRIFLAVKVVEKIDQTKRPIERALVKINSDKLDSNMVTPKTGRVIMELDWDKEYDLVIKKRNFISTSEYITTVVYDKDSLTENVTINKEILMDNYVAGKEFVLEDIYFDFEKYNIREDAKPSLDKLVSMLKLNNRMMIQLNAHTDCRGDVDFNQTLSQQRADSAVDYIVSSGIDRDRLKAKGYGESQAIARCDCDNCTEEQHQQNRRTSFSIIQ